MTGFQFLIIIILGISDIITIFIDTYFSIWYLFAIILLTLIIVVYNSFRNNKYKDTIKNSFIIFLLICIVVILLYNNGTIYKLKIINKDNIQSIISSNVLSTEEKAIIMTKYFLNENNVIGKSIYEVLK